MRTKTSDAIAELMIKTFAVVAIILIVFIFYFVFSKAASVIANSGIGLITNTGFDEQISEAFYAPIETPVLTFGMLGLIMGTLLSTLIALTIATLISIGGAVAICELAPKPVSTVLTAFVRLLASIPSVVFGLIGVITVVPFIEAVFITVDMQMEFLEFFQMTGRNLLSSVIVLTFMIAPTIISLCVDAINSVPNMNKEAGYAFGMSHMRVILKIILPSARSGIIAGIILGAGRGIGEAIAVSMVCGGVGFMPDISHGFAALFTPILPLSAAIVNKSEAISVPAVESALFACGAILLTFNAALSVSARGIQRYLRRRAGYAD